MGLFWGGDMACNSAGSLCTRSAKEYKEYAKCTRSANGLALTGRAMPATSQQMAVEGLMKELCKIGITAWSLLKVDWLIQCFELWCVGRKERF